MIRNKYMKQLSEKTKQLITEIGTGIKVIQEMKNERQKRAPIPTDIEKIKTEEQWIKKLANHDDIAIDAAFPLLGRDPSNELVSAVDDIVDNLDLKDVSFLTGTEDTGFEIDDYDFSARELAQEMLNNHYGKLFVKVSVAIDKKYSVRKSGYFIAASYKEALKKAYKWSKNYPIN